MHQLAASLPPDRVWLRAQARGKISSCPNSSCNLICKDILANLHACWANLRLATLNHLVSLCLDAKSPILTCPGRGKPFLTLGLAGRGVPRHEHVTAAERG